MNTVESQLFKRTVVYILLAMMLRLMMYGVPSLSDIWLFVCLSFSVGIGGSALTWWKETRDRRAAFLGIAFVTIGLLPIQYLL